MADNIPDSLCCSQLDTVDNTRDINDFSGEFLIDYWNPEAEQVADQSYDLDVGVFTRGIDDDSLMENAVILELPKFSKNFQASDFDALVRKHVGEDNLEKLESRKYPNIWVMKVKTKEIRESLLRLWKIKIKNKTCWINPYHSYELRGFLYWLPHFIPDDDVKTQLSQFGDVLILDKEVHDRWNKKIHSEVRYFGLKLKDGMVKNDMPHFLKFDGYRALVIVRGRKPACFHCREFGHSKKDCKKYKEKLNEYCKNPEVGKLRTKPRGRRHRPESDVKRHTQDNNHQDGTKLIPGSSILENKSSNNIDYCLENVSNERKLKINKQKSEILVTLQSLKSWKEETIEMVEHTLENTKKSLKKVFDRIKAEEKLIECSIETMVKISLDDMKRTTIEMTEKTSNKLKNIVTKHFDLDPNQTLENLINFEAKKSD